MVFSLKASIFVLLVLLTIAQAFVLRPEPRKKPESVMRLCERLQRQFGQIANREARGGLGFLHFGKRSVRSVPEGDDSLQVPGLALAWYCRRRF
ncbi:hypothetical protein AAVH_22601 [Aphelenchoides avenae]|nr:hypothetical protein AAVH_22601 [Aphelenchus avenae]